jgi:hypothetical protein
VIPKIDCHVVPDALSLNVPELAIPTGLIGLAAYPFKGVTGSCPPADCKIRPVFTPYGLGVTFGFPEKFVTPVPPTTLATPLVWGVNVVCTVEFPADESQTVLSAGKKFRESPLDKDPSLRCALTPSKRAQ